MEMHLIRLKSTLKNNSDVEESNEKFLNRIFSKLPITFVDHPNRDFSFVFIETGGTEEEFVKILPTLNNPIYLLTNGDNNSLAASLEILTYLKNHNYDGEIIHGDDSFIIKKIANIFSLPIESIKHHFGVVGKPSNWLISSNVDECQLRNVFSSELIDISFDEFLNEINKNSYEDNCWTLSLKEHNFDKDTLERALYIYGALKRLVVKYNLSGLTVRCFDLLKEYKNTSCLALAILNAEGIIATCEGDETTMLTMFLIREAAGLSSFQVNPSRIDISKSVGVFAHCTVPLNMINKYSLMTHFESSIGVAIKGELETKEITLVKLKNDLREIHVIEGEIVENLNDCHLCRTQIRVKFFEDISKLLNNPFGNHQVIVYGKIKDKIVKYLENKILFTK